MEHFQLRKPFFLPPNTAKEIILDLCPDMVAKLNEDLGDLTIEELKAKCAENLLTSPVYKENVRHTEKKSKYGMLLYEFDGIWCIGWKDGECVLLYQDPDDVNHFFVFQYFPPQPENADPSRRGGGPGGGRGVFARSSGGLQGGRGRPYDRVLTNLSERWAHVRFSELTRV